MTLKFFEFRAVVKIHVLTKLYPAECSGSWLIVVAEKKKLTKTILSVATADSKNYSISTAPEFILRGLVIDYLPCIYCNDNKPVSGNVVPPTNIACQQGHRRLTK